VKYATRQQWEAGRDALADLDPTSHGFMARLTKAMGSSRLIAERTWDLGCPDLDLAPLKHWPWNDGIDARAARREDDLFASPAQAIGAAEDAAILDAAQTKIEETRMVGRSRRGLLELIEATNGLITGFTPLAIEVQNQALRIADSISGDEADIKSAERAVNVLWKLSQTHQAMVSSAERLLKAERQLLGGPDEILGIQSMGGAPSSEDDVLDRLAEVQAALLRDRSRRD
jgi:hypothetical protein